MLEPPRSRPATSQPRLERRAPGGRRTLPAHAAQRQALEHRRRVSPPGRGPAEPRGARRRVRRADRLRGRPCGRRRARRTKAARDRPRRARGDPRRRRVPVARVADALRHRARRGARAVRDRGARGAAGRREPAGPLHGELNYLTDEPGLFGIFTPENFALLERGPRPALLELRRPAGSSARGPTCRRPTSSSTSRRRRSSTRASTPPTDHGYCFGPVIVKPTLAREGHAARAARRTRSRACSATSSRPTRTARA